MLTNFAFVVIFKFVFEKNHSAIAQWWSIRLLTEGLQVRVLLAEQLKPQNIFGVFVFKENL